MLIPVQPEYSEFIPKFMHLLFEPLSTVVLFRHAENGVANTQLSLDAAIETLTGYKDEPNIYFRASAFDDSSSGYRADNCLCTRAFYLDIDYGSTGHSRPSPFDTIDDVVGYLLTMPFKPSIAWHTGHGVQVAYLLDQPFVFETGGGPAGALERYKTVGQKLKAMAMADDAFTPEHVYRVPLSINSKRHRDPEAQDVRGQLLWCNEHQRYTIDQIESMCEGYGLDDHMHAEAEADKAEACPATAETTCIYEDLPEDIRESIEDCGAERSNRLFSIIGRMVRAGYSHGTILEAVGYGSDFAEKFGTRPGGLSSEVDRCIQKIESGRYVYPSSLSPTVRVYNTPVEIDLADCPEVEDSLSLMLDKYVKVTKSGLPERVRTAARFHEHMFRTHNRGVLESKCGAGKSTWALCHMALNAGTERYIYVTETVEALYKAADTLDTLCDVSVGRLHGFNPKQCHDLCGKHHAWQNCNPNHPKSICHKCGAREECCFYNRDQQRTFPVICMTHSGLIRALEDGSPVLKAANIIVDEGLNSFNSRQVHVSKLRHLERHAQHVGLDLALFFPFTGFAARQALLQWQVENEASVFASRNYIYRNPDQTSALSPIHDQLRSLYSLGLRSPDPMHAKPGDLDRAYQTLADLINFFRPSSYSDASYAYKESRGEHGNVLTVKRNRFDLSVLRPYRSIWILNASAQLSPQQYPDDMPVYTCPDLPDNSHLVTLHCVKANPTKTRQEENVMVSQVALCFGPRVRRHTGVLVATDKAATSLDSVEEQLGSTHGDSLEIVHLTRGRIKGVNSAGHCSLAYLTGMATFTGLDDCALFTALATRRTYPDRPYVYNESGSPNWPGGRMLVPVMRNYFALTSLDLLYQTIWRTAVRNDQPVEAIVAVPDGHWLTTLWRTVMPGFRLGSAYKAQAGSEVLDAAPVGQDEDVQGTPVLRWDYVHEPSLFGLRIISSEPGTEFRKKQVAEELGYTGKRQWSDNKMTIMRLLSPFFEEKHHKLVRRRADTGHA